MSLHKLEVEEVIQKRRLLDQKFTERKEERNYTSKRKSVTKIVNNSSLFPGLLTSYSTKFLRKTSEKSKSPLQEPTIVRKKSLNHKVERREFVPQTQCQSQELGQRGNPSFVSPKSEATSSILLSSSLQQQIKRIKTLSRFMLDMKLPSAIPSRTRRDREKDRRVFDLGTQTDEGKPLIEVKMQRKNGFLRPVMLVRDPLQHQNQQKQLAEKKLKSLSRPKEKEKLKTAPEISQFGLHIKSHQEVFDQESKMRETKHEIIKRFRSTWTRKLSKSSKKLPEIEVSPWIVTEHEHD